MDILDKKYKVRIEWEAGEALELMMPLIDVRHSSVFMYVPTYRPNNHERRRPSKIVIFGTFTEEEARYMNLEYKIHPLSTEDKKVEYRRK
jgi:hypothetical protein